MQHISAVPAVIEGGGEGAVGHVGLHALGSFADRLGVPETLSAAVPWAGERAPVHDRGKVLVQAMLMLAGGGSSCADIEHLRVEGRLFGFVASDSTTYRMFRDITPAVLADLHAAFAAVRRDVWARSSVTNRADPVVLDIDASLVQIHSENKTGTAPTYKGGFGFHPMLCFADATGETLASLLRPGNAGANDIADHLAVLDAAVAQLPETVAAGHRPGDAADAVSRPVVVRTDSAGCTNGFVAGCRARNIGFAVVARRSAQIHSALLRTIGDEAWTPALTQGGDVRPIRAVAEEAGHQPVEAEAVVEAGVHEVEEVLGRDRRGLREQPDDDVALGGLEADAGAITGRHSGLVGFPGHMDVHLVTARGLVSRHRQPTDRVGDDPTPHQAS